MAKFSEFCIPGIQKQYAKFSGYAGTVSVGKDPFEPYAASVQQLVIHQFSLILNSNKRLIANSKRPGIFYEFLQKLLLQVIFKKFSIVNSSMDVLRGSDSNCFRVCSKKCFGNPSGILTDTSGRIHRKISPRRLSIQ